MDMAEDLTRSLVAGAATTPEEMEERGWPVEEQIDAVLDHLRAHMSGGTQQLATDRELYIVEELIAADVLDEGARGYFRRMAPAEQSEREQWQFERREQHKEMRAALEEWREWRELHGYPMPDHIRQRLIDAGF